MARQHDMTRRWSCPLPTMTRNGPATLPTMTRQWSCHLANHAQTVVLPPCQPSGPFPFRGKDRMGVGEEGDGEPPQPCHLPVLWSPFRSQGNTPVRLLAPDAGRSASSVQTAPPVHRPWPRAAGPFPFRGKDRMGVGVGREPDTLGQERHTHTHLPTARRHPGNVVGHRCSAPGRGSVRQPLGAIRFPARRSRVTMPIRLRQAPRPHTTLARGDS